MRRCALSFVFFAALVFSPGSGASEIHVPKDYPTIQEALDAAVDGDTVWVHPGTYVENIDFKGKAVALRSTDGCGSTVIDGNRNGSVVTFRSGEPPKAVIDGFTITNGYQPTWNGGGIHCDEWASPTIINNLIMENEARIGGGICGEYCDSLIEKNVIKSNIATHDGGGVYIIPFSLAYIRNNIISNNQSKGVGGGGLVVLEFSGAEVVNNEITQNYCSNNIGGLSWLMECCKNGCVIGNIISGNRAENGIGGMASQHVPQLMNNIIMDNEAISFNAGGVYFDIIANDPSYIRNNIICRNRADGSGGGIMFGGGLYYFNNNTVSDNYAAAWGGGIAINWGVILIMRNSIVWGNEAGLSNDEILPLSTPDIQYSDIGGGWPGTGNIDADPLFADPAAADYHLTFDSPCRNMGYNGAPGLPDTDFEGDPRIPDYGITDMGGEEFYHHLYFEGTIVPGSPVCVKVTTWKLQRPVALGLGSGILDPPKTTPLGPLYLQSPIKTFMIGVVPPDGIVSFTGRVPIVWMPGEEHGLQARIFDELTNLMVMKVE